MSHIFTTGVAGFKGRFRLIVSRTDGTVTKDSGWFDNLITDNGLDFPAIGPTQPFGGRFMFPGCFVGTGSAAPAFTDTSLQAYLATHNSAGPALPGDNNTYTASLPPYYKHYSSYRFGTGTAAGNISEIAVGASPTNIFNRALILDGLGAPTTITVLIDEVLDVIYEFRVYPPTVDETNTFVLNGVGQTVSSRAYDIASVPDIMRGIRRDGPYDTASNFVTTNSTGLAPLTGSPTGPYAGPSGSNTVFDSYVVGSRELGFTNYYALGDCVGTWKGLLIAWSHGTRQIHLVTPIVKSNAQQMTIAGKFVWNRYP